MKTSDFLLAIGAGAATFFVLQALVRRAYRAGATGELERPPVWNPLNGALVTVRDDGTGVPPGTPTWGGLPGWSTPPFNPNG